MPGPSQIANSFGSDQQIQQQVLPFTRSNAKVIYGNLLTLPVGDGLLYVQPLYTQRNTGQGTYPQLRFVLASFGDAVGVGTTLNDALKDVLGTTVKDNVSNGTGGSASRRRWRDLQRRTRAAAAGRVEVRGRPEVAGGRGPAGLREGPGRGARARAAGDHGR